MAKKQYNIPVKGGDRLPLTVDTLASSGDGIARHEGYTIFIPGGLTGDRVMAHIVKTTPRFAVARVVERIESSPHRTEPVCPVFDDCGGCKFQNLKYEQQMAFKTGVVTDALQHIGKLELPFAVTPMPADPVYHYRNKGSFAVQKPGNRLKIGFFKQGTHEVVDSEVCDILVEPINAVKEWLRGLLEKHNVSIYDERSHKGLVRGMMIRHSPVTHETLIGLITNKGRFEDGFLADLADATAQKRFGISGIVQNLNHEKTNIILGPRSRVLVGQDFLTDRLGDLQFHLSLNSFFQINPYQAVSLYNLIREWVISGPVVDAYCGNGGISLWLAQSGIEVTGIDECIPAVEDARKSAKLNGLNGCRFLQGTFEQHLAKPKTLMPVKTLVLDPPRKGCSSGVIAGIAKLNPERIVYVSCNPSTLARDLALLKESYTLKDVRMIDLFPQTQHVESVVLLERN